MFPPGFEAALRRAYAVDALFSQQHRQLRAAPFVRRSVVQNQFPVRPQNQDHQPSAEPFGVLCDIFNLAAEDITGCEERAGPQLYTPRIEKQESAEIHANDARHRRGHSIRPGKKFREKQGPRALLLKHFLGAPYTRIQFQRNPAQRLENFDSFCPAEFIPDGIGGNRAQQA